MSINDSILNLLDLKDDFIKFNENFCQSISIKGILSKVFFATLSFDPTCCQHCGAVFDKNIIKWGFKSSLIKLPNVSGFNTYLKLNKQRYFCKHCNSSFVLNNDICDKHCFISNKTKLSISLDAKNKISEKDIASRNNVSHSTVNRIINSFFDSHKVNYNYLPENLCFDEFKSTKSADGAMSFIFCENKTGKIIDILESRKLHKLEKYFLRFSKDSRDNVKTIVIDMYSPYMSLIENCFPNASIIIDKFHIVQLFSRSLNKTRINLMKKDDTNYNKLKKYWKLLLKNSNFLNSTNFNYHICFKDRLREVDIVNYLLDLDVELISSYELYQNILFAIDTRNFELLKRVVLNLDDNVSYYMKTSVNTIIKYLPYIENTFKYNYTNGILEGINNKIKTIKRIAFGYRSFFHFKNRILIMQNLLHLKSA